MCTVFNDAAIFDDLAKIYYSTLRTDELRYMYAGICNRAHPASQP